MFVRQAGVLKGGGMTEGGGTDASGVGKTHQRMRNRWEDYRETVGPFRHH